MVLKNLSIVPYSQALTIHALWKEDKDFVFLNV